MARQTQNHSLSEDLAQEIFVIVLQKARDNLIQNPGRIIRQTAVSLFIGHIHKKLVAIPKVSKALIFIHLVMDWIEVEH